MTDRVKKGGLQVATVLHELVAKRIAPGTGIDPDAFWAAFEKILDDLAPENKALLARRDEVGAVQHFPQRTTL